MGKGTQTVKRVRSPVLNSYFLIENFSTKPNYVTSGNLSFTTISCWEFDNSPERILEVLSRQATGFVFAIAALLIFYRNISNTYYTSARLPGTPKLKQI